MSIKSGGRAGGANISSGNISFRRVSMPTESKEKNLPS